MKLKIEEIQRRVHNMKLFNIYSISCQGDQRKRYNGF